MRKDVKFGLTIGAILVVTLVIYVIVLSRGSSMPQHIAIAMPSQSDQAASPAESTDSAGATHTDDAKTDNPADSDANNSAGANANANANVNAGTSETPAETVAPATQPAAGAQANSDWEGALNNGPPAALAAPERTVTPTIDNNSSNALRNGITRSQTTPMIDSLPATQPSRPMMADIPMLDASASPPPPPAAAAVPRQDPTPTYTSSAANVPSDTPRTHRVASGESAYTISQTVYGSGRYYKKILAANPNVDPRHLRIGQILVIPELTDTDKPASPAAANTEVPAPIDIKTAYRVVSGDSLESISRKVYGTPGMMDKLYEANKTLIGPDENVLKIGWVLKLPEVPVTGNAQ
jgi:nucleoid-associated protein YgaU